MRFLIPLLLSLLVGCASIQPAKMVPDKTSYGANNQCSVALNIGGGSPSVTGFSATITPEQFTEAVRLSIEGAKLFGKVQDKTMADYILTADITFVATNPATGFFHANWDIANRVTGTKLWSKRIMTEGKATFSEEFSGMKRAMMMLERSAKANIENALSEVASLQLVCP
jgi:hypothetical protein